MDLAFSDCDWLVSATLLNGIPTTGNGTFQYCYRLVSVTLPDSITEVGDSAFDGCSSLAEITLPNSVTRLGTSAFYWCGSLTNLTLPDHVQSLGTFVFGSCSGLTGLTIPASVTNIGVGACLFCNNLKAITVNPLNRYYRSVDGVLFDYSQTTLLQFPGGKTGAYTIPTGVTIGDNSFMGAVGIASITIPDGVTALDNFVFASTANLTNATIYDSVTNLADGAFQNCPSLRAVYFTGPPPNLGSQVFAGDNQAKVYFIPGTGAWGTTFGGLPTLPWNGLPPIITAGPQSVLTNLGAAVRFTVSAGGTWLNYQWLFNGAPILGATSSGYTLTNAQLPNAGLYAVVVSNALGSATSATADLTITFPHTALANALVMSGFVVQVTVTDGGWGYTNPPLVEIVGGGGSGAQAVAVLANGQIVAIDILDAGFGYTDIPQILIAPPFIPPATLGLVPLTLLTFTNLTPGLGYQLQTFNSSTWFNRGTNFTAANSCFTQMVSGTIAPNGWRLALTPVPTQAQAVAQVFNGFVIGATVTSGGSGYTTNPAVTIVSNGAGSNATATATLANGAVAAVHIQHAGNGYTVSPSILIEPPPVIALSPTVTQVMELELGNLSSWGSYQLRSAPTPTGPWSDLGAPFTAAAATNTQYIGVSGSVGFFRVVYVP